MEKLCVAMKVTAALLHPSDTVLKEERDTLLLGGDHRHLDPNGEDFPFRGHPADKAEADPL